ncbi:MAG: hypothetical protein R3B72_31370 [Polyangiaceae bacterium]
MILPRSDFPPAMTPAQDTDEPLEPTLEDFVSEAELARQLAARRLTRVGHVIHLRDGRRYVLVEAVRILGAASAETDPYGLTGTTDTLRSFLRRGFVMNAERLALGRHVYDAEYGYLLHRMADADASGVNPVVR